MSDDDYAILADRSAADRRPILLRSAAAHAAGFEEKAVAAVLNLTGRAGDLRPRLLAESRARAGRPALSFALLEELEPSWPVALRASRLRFDYNGVFMQLMNDFAGTPMWSAWSDADAARGDGDDRPLALVFSWPRVRGCRELCVLHDAGTSSGWSGTRLQREVGGTVFTIETLPSFLGGVGLLAAGGEDADGPA